MTSTRAPQSRSSLPPPAPGPWPRPQGAWTWAALAAVAAILFFSQLHPLFDPDIYLHLRDGRRWVETGFRPGLDPFTYTVERLPVDATEVLFRAGLHGLWSATGFDGLIAAKALLATLFFLALGLLMLRRGLRLEAVALILLAVRFLPSFWLFFRERPYWFTYLGLAAVLIWLAADPWLKGETHSSRSAWWFPVWVAVWANLHPGFMALFGFLGAYFAEALWDGWVKDQARARVRAGRLGLAAVAAFIAGAFNPLGFGLYPYSVHMTNSAFFSENIQEWAGLDWSRHRDIFLLLIACWSVQLLAWRRARPADWIAQAVFTVMAVKSVRHVPLALLALLPPLAGNLAALADRWGQGFRWTRARRLGAWAGIFGLAALGWLAANQAGARLGQLGRFPNRYPETALAWLESRPVAGRWLLPIDWSDYLSWKTQGKIKVFMDGRLPLFGEKLFRDHQAMLTANEPDLLDLLDRYQIQVVTVKTDNLPQYYSRLTESGRWDLVYFDPLCYVFARPEGPNRAWVQAAAFHHLAPWRPSPDYFDTSDLPAALAELRRAAAQAPQSCQPAFLTGQILMWTGKKAEARQAFGESLRLDPNQYAAHFNLGILCAEDGLTAEAQPHFQAAIRLAPPAMRSQLEAQAAAVTPDPEQPK